MAEGSSKSDVADGIVGGGGGTRTTAEVVLFLLLDFAVDVLFSGDFASKLVFPSDLLLVLTSVLTSVLALVAGLAEGLTAGAGFFAGSALTGVLAWAGAADVETG